MGIKLVKPIKLENKEDLSFKEKTTKQKKEEFDKRHPKTPKEKLPPDTYKEEISPKELSISDTGKLVFSVKRAGEEGLPHVDIRLYIMTEVYTGFTKKGINFPLELFEEFLEMCNQVNDECEKKGI